MIANEFLEAARGLGFEVERSSSSYHVVRNDKTFARVDRCRPRCVDTMYIAMSRLEEKAGLSLMALLFEFAQTPVNERKDDDYRVYAAYEYDEGVGGKLFVTSYGVNGEKLILDNGIGGALYASYDRATKIAKNLSKVMGKKFEVEKAEQ